MRGLGGAGGGKGGESRLCVCVRGWGLGREVMGREVMREMIRIRTEMMLIDA